MGTTFIEDELLKRSSSGILTPMRDGDVIQSSVLAMTTSTNPALNAATSTAIIDEFGGVIITLTAGGNAQTLQSPTSSTAGKAFTVVSDDSNGANTIEVNGITLSAGEAQRFIWDGSAWVAVTAVDADDITLTPTGDIVATDVQAGIAELDTEKMKCITSVDNEIARFDSTGGDVQGYSSNAPTASDAGNVVMTGGLDNTPIGQTIPVAGAFTVLKAGTDPTDEHGVGDQGYNDRRYSFNMYGVTWDESADTYERTGMQAGLACGESHGNAVNPIQAAMRRCIVEDGGDVVYYLDPTSSYNRIGQAPSVTGDDDAGAANKVSEAVVATGTDDGAGVAYKLTDTAVFTAAESAYVGKYVHNTTDGTYAKVTAKDSDNVLSIDTNIMANGEVFNVGTLCGVDADYVGHYVHDKTGDVYAMITAKDSDAALSIDANIMANLDEYEICTAVLNGTDGQVMLEIPMFYHRYSYSGTSHTYEISQTALEGFSIHPEFVVAGVVKPYVHVGAYEGCLYDASASIYANGIRLEAGSVTFVVEAGSDSIECNTETNGFTNLEIGDKFVVSGATDGGNNKTFTVDGIVSDRKVTVAEAVTGAVADGAVIITSEMDFVNDKLSSVSGKTPAVYGTRDNFRVVAVKRGTGWSQQDFDNASVVQLAYIVEYADFFSQSMIGNGCTDWAAGTWDAYNDYNPINKTGLSNSLGNATGNSTLGDGTVGSYMSYRGIENFYGHLWKWIDGINVNDHVPYVCSNPADFADDTATNYTELGVVLPNASGHQNTLEQQDRGFLPASVGAPASASTKITDYYYQASGWRVTALGGGAAASTPAGAFCWYLYYSAGTRYRSVSARLQKK